jgi:putative copper export protein
MLLVRLLLFLALAAVAVAGLLFLYSRDRRYLRFIGQVLKFTILLGVIVLAFFAFERLVGPML